jgi:hypothetical protein
MLNQTIIIANAIAGCYENFTEELSQREALALQTYRN